MRDALQAIADDGCEENTGTWRQGFLDCLTYYPTDPTNWCPMCVAIAALADFVCCMGLSDEECAATPVRHCEGLRSRGQ